MSKPRKIQASNAQILLGRVAPLALLAACSSDVVDLGNDGLTQSLERGARCADSSIVRGPVEVNSQPELEALSGCEEVRGDLNIRIYDGTDLTPLASLRSVTGRFTLGLTADTTAENQDNWEEEAALREQVAAAGWLTTLQGVESLERVGSLEMDRVAAPDLRPFSNLSSVAGNDDPLYAGHISIQRAPALVNLAGLENAAGVAEVSIHDTPALESLFGLRISRDVPGFISLGDCPLLSDIFALAPLESAGFLSIERCGVEDLDALQGLLYAESITIRENPELLEMFGIGNASFGELTIDANPRLVGVPTFVNGGNDVRVRISGNSALESLALTLRVGFGSIEFEGQELFIGNAWIDIRDNPRLAALAIDNDDPLIGISAGRLFAVHRNAALQRVDLGSLRTLELLSIGDNPELSEVVLGNLERANQISVNGNPKLVTAALRAVPTFEGTFSGNADDVAAPDAP